MGKYTKRSGVYMILCNTNGKVYIGSSVSVKKRINSAKAWLNASIHTNKPLQEDFDKYGRNQFTFVILEECEASDILKTENKWIGIFKSLQEDKGYNICLPIGDFKRGEKDRKLANKEVGSKKGTPVTCIYIITREVRSFSSLSAAAYELKVDVKKAQECMQYWRKGRKGSKTTGGCLFIPTDIYDPTFDYFGYFHPKVVKPKKEITKKPPIPYEERNIKRRPIKLVKDGIETVFPSSAKAIEALGLTKSKVQEALKYPETRSHRGYKFYYMD